MSSINAEPDGVKPPADRSRSNLPLTWRQRRGRWDVRYSPYLYIAPFFLVFAITGLFPILYTAFISMQDWDHIRGTGTFVGFDQFYWILHDPNFWKALRNTFSIFLLSSVPQVIAATAIAAMLDSNLRAKTFWRMGVLLPYVVAPIAVALIFSQMFADQTGLANDFLGHFGFEKFLWHTDVIPSHIAIATMVNFRWTGYNTLILLAAMQAVPRDLYEAAEVDGAGAMRRFFSLTIPMIRPTFVFVIIMSTIGGLQIFEEPLIFDSTGRGGANGQWLTITLYMYNMGWGDFNFGRAAAVAWLLFLLIMIITLLNTWVTRRFVSGDEAVKKTKKVSQKIAEAGGK